MAAVMSTADLIIMAAICLLFLFYFRKKRRKNEEPEKKSEHNTDGKGNQGDQTGAIPVIHVIFQKEVEEEELAVEPDAVDTRSKMDGDIGDLFGVLQVLILGTELLNVVIGWKIVWICRNNAVLARTEALKLAGDFCKTTFVKLGVRSLLLLAL